MKILFVLNQLPYPPRNGITIPTFNYLSRLACDHHVSLLLVKENIEQLDHEQVANNKKYVEKLWIVERYRIQKIVAVKDEILNRRPYFLGWNCDSKKLYDCLDGQAFDVVWGSPVSVADVMESIYNILGPSPVYVAGISDCYTAVLRNMGRKLFMKGLDCKTRILYALQWTRSGLLGRMEAKILQKYDLILVQTDADKVWLSNISAGKLYNKITVLPNGVNESLFQLPIEYRSQNILFLGALEGGYKKVLSWIIENIWSIIRCVRGNASFFIIGKGASTELRNLMLKDNHIIYSEYVPDICDVFREKAVMLAPVFKNYGLINKVIESMAAGVPVVGDSGSFNGIPGFENGHHGIIAKNAQDMAQAALNVLGSPQSHLKIARSARALVLKHFSWQDRIHTIIKKLESLKYGK
ncbi:MAG: glycosyltransferase [Deltaproteobacteria bacterium]|nr:glycosyltransferase [Deltaproteobacteria bacterium]